MGIALVILVIAIVVPLTAMYLIDKWRNGPEKSTPSRPDEPSHFDEVFEIHDKHTP